jgi:hypothetical protein
VTIGCPTSEELLAAAAGRPGDTRAAAILRHIQHCDSCLARMRENRELAALLHLMPVAPSTSCLDDDAIAALAEGGLSADSEAMVHVAVCANCRSRLAAVALLLNDTAVRSELDALQPARRLARQRWSARDLTLSGSLVAAAVAAIVFLGPMRSENSGNPRADTGETHREAAITSTIGPRIVSPISADRFPDSLRWTSVPQSDLYRVRIWNREGTVVWTTETRDTTVALPSIIQYGTSYMWEVGARTGWDRWVSSDFVELAIPAPKAR